MITETNRPLVDTDSTLNLGAEVKHQSSGEQKNDGTKLMVPSAEGRPVDENEPTSKKETNKNNEKVTAKSGDIFDDLTALGRPLDEIVPSEKILTSLPLRKPKRDDWVRVHPEINTRVYIYENKDDQSWYVVLPNVVEPLSDVVRYVQLSLTTTYKGNVFVWPVPIPTERKPHNAHVSAFAGAKLATKEWVRISWGTGEYDIYRRDTAKVEPAWPAQVESPSEMLRFAAKVGAFEVIDTPDHPVVLAHLGRD